MFLRTSEGMSKAARAVERDIAKQSEALGGSAANTLALKAAAAGLGDQYKPVIESLQKLERSSVAAKKESVALFAGSEAAATAYYSKLDALTAKTTSEINQVNAAQKRFKDEIEARSAANGLVSPADSALLKAATAATEQRKRQLQVEFTEQTALIRQEAVRAAQVRAAADAQVAAARKIIDAQSGVKAGYREELALLRELRDAGALTPVQFKQSRSGLEAAQPRAANAARDLALSQEASSAATASAASRVYAAFLIAEAAAADQAAASEARLAEVTKAQAAASASAQSAQQAAANTRNAYIAGINEEVAALFRSRDAQREINALRAGVAPVDAAKLAKFGGDREFIASIYAQIAAQQKLQSEFGKTEAEKLRQQAADRGLINTTNSAIGRLEALAKANDDVAASERNRKAGQDFLANLRTRAAGINDDGTQKAQSALLAEQAAFFGVGKEADAYLKKLTLADEKTGQFGKSAFGARNRLLTLQYTISDVIASAGSGISPLTILLQQGGQVFDAFGGANAREGAGFFKNFFGTLGEILPPARLALLGVAGAAGTLAYGYYQGAKQQREFLDSLVLTGNYAGQTADSVRKLAKDIAGTTTATESVAKDFAQALISTGEIGPAVFDRAARAATLYGEATGKTAKEVASDFASMSQGVTKWVTDHNRQLNLLSAAQIAQIRRLEEMGRATEAMGIFFDALNQRLPKLQDNMGNLDRSIVAVSKTFSYFKNLLFDFGKDETPEQKIDSLTQKLLAAKARLSSAQSTFGIPQFVVDLRQGDVNKLGADLDNEKARKQLGDVAASASARIADVDKRAEKADLFIEGFEKRAKSVAALNRVLAEADAAFKAKAEQGAPVSAKTQKEITDRIRKDFEPDKGPRTKIDREPEQIRKAQLAADLKALQEAYQNERDTIAFHLREVAAQYAAGNVSLKAYNDAKVQEIEDGTKRTVDAQLKIAARLNAALEDPLVKADPSRQVEIKGQIAEALATIDKTVVKGARDVSAANAEAGLSYKQLGDQVANYRANLLQLQGDEAGAAKIRTKQALDAARELSKRSQGSPGAIGEQEIATYERALNAQEALRKIKADTGRINETLAISEERIALLQKTGAVGELEALELQGLARQKVVALLEAQLAAMEAIRQTSADPQLLLDIERTRLELDKLKASLDPLKEKFDNLFKDAGEGFFSSLIGNKGIKGALASFGNTIESEINRVLSKELSRLTFGEGGILGGAGGFFADAFGGKGGSETAAQASAQAAATAAITAAQASSAAAVATANTAAEAATATAIVTAIGASTTAIVAAIGAGAAAKGLSGGLSSLGGIGFGGSDGIGFPFDGGGYTGPGGKYEPAGIVHKGEVVWSQDDVQAAGGPQVVNALRLRRGSGYFDGGIVASLSGPSYANGGAVLPRPRSAEASRGRGDAGGGATHYHNWGGITVDSHGAMDRAAERRSGMRVGREAAREFQRRTA